MYFENGLLCIKFCGLIEWSTRTKWTNYASKLYILHAKFVYFYNIYILLRHIMEASTFPDKLKVFWRLWTIIMIAIRLFFLIKKSPDIKLNLQIIEELKDYKFKFGKKINKQLYKHIMKYSVFLLLFVLIIIADYLFISTHGAKPSDAVIEKSTTENTIVSFIGNIYELIAAIHRLVLLFSADFVVTYLLLLAKVYLKQTAKFVKYAKTYAEIRRCIIIHQRVLDMKASMIRTLCIPMLVTVLQTFAISMAFFEITIQNKMIITVITIMVFVFMLLILFQLHSQCTFSQAITDQVALLQDACHRKVLILTRDKEKERFMLTVMADRCCKIPPSFFGAGLLYKFSISTFTAILGIVLSHYVFMISLYYSRKTN